MGILFLLPHSFSYSKNFCLTFFEKGNTNSSTKQTFYFVYQIKVSHLCRCGAFICL